MSTSPGAPIRPPSARPSDVLTRRMLNKVPRVTAFFWLIKLLCATVGQSAAEYVGDTLGFGRADAAKVSASVLAVLLLVQLRQDRYVPLAYWLVVVAISVFGALMAELLTETVGLAAGAVTALFAAGLGLVCAAWWALERTLSLETIVTTRRELFYWAAVVFAFALGSVVGDAVVERAGIGYAVSIATFGAVLGLIALAQRLSARAIVTFWLAFVLTGPLGAAVGDAIARDTAPHNGLGLGTAPTTALFVAVIVGLVGYLTVSRCDQPPAEAAT